MDTSILLGNFLSPPILFFLLGIAATLLRSDLELPQPLPKVFSLYLLFAIGFRGGVELSHSGLSNGVMLTMGAAMLMAFGVPLFAFLILRLRLDTANAAAIAATYGSISAVTFITAAAFLDSSGVTYSGHMIAAMALMESPAIIVGVLLARLLAPKDGGTTSWPQITRDAVLNGSVFLLIGALVIGALTGEKGGVMLKPFTHDLFAGVLALFLLDMGLVAARRLGQLRTVGVFCVSFALLLPFVNAALGLALARFCALSPGDAFLFVILSASASYIAVPAAMRLAVPEANPSLYVTMSLAVTFPLNLIVGIPLYWWAVNAVA
ncbi:MAG: sodium-dependent bicarbonate transport family permease [Candidatus Didemnitutus sp.]|nr:sodium-dependent bicarbonate transport family permease [Candidatus Didemnitutus sp.]